MEYHQNERKERLAITLRGTVQGVGFRPFVFRLAMDLQLTGWVCNSTEGVTLEVEGKPDALRTFLKRLQDEKPPHAVYQSVENVFLDPVEYRSFEIKESKSIGTPTALMVPDIATCPECLKEIFDPQNRRYQYPFTNCTHCGPRFSIIEALPYDRKNTSMKKFAMCPQCQREYDDPSNRRFHAQPNACPVCGPHVELWSADGTVLQRDEEALIAATKAIEDGKIVAVKGIGGFHLMADARNEQAVRTLRERKHREEKPFAIMSPSLETVKQLCVVNDMEERLLTSPEAPIVLLEKKNNFLAPSLAPANPYLGIMLPYSPLHHILLRQFGFPVVATSGNLSDEPICIDEYEALDRLKGIADLFLVHNRPIVRHVDDSLTRVVAGRELVLRRARGYAPLPIQVLSKTSTPILAVGAHLKNTVALALHNNIFLSQHIGDLETPESYNAFKRVLEDFQMIYAAPAVLVASDMHPDYLSTKYATNTGKQLIRIQHHFAHIVSCIAENRLEGEVLGVAWDGTGYGLDGTVWGGEFLKASRTTFTRFATFRSFPLIGGEQAIKEPRRTALGLLFELYGNTLLTNEKLLKILLRSFTEKELVLFTTMASRGINTPRTSSVGRLFDAVAALVGLRSVVRYEGQAAMELEFLATQGNNTTTYPIHLLETGEVPFVVDWSTMFAEIFEEALSGVEKSTIARKFHNTLVEIIVLLAHKAGEDRIALSGGCFQNRLLTDHTILRLRQEGFRPYWHQRVPPNDGGIALGQAVVAQSQGNEKQ